MTVQIFDNTTPGVPAYTSAPGSLITLLDYLLVTVLGWTKPFSGTNKAVYKQPASTNGFYLRVVDTGSTKYSAAVRGFETMTGVDTGAGAFPTVAQYAGDGPSVWKTEFSSNTLWRFITDGKIFYLGTRDTTYNVYVWWGFGDFQSLITGDQYNTILIPAVNNSSCWVGHGAATGSNASHNYVARAGSQTGTASLMQKMAGVEVTGQNKLGFGGIAYPNPVTGGIDLSPVWLTDRATGVIRGVLPGVWNILHDTVNGGIMSHGDTFAGAGNLTGRSFMVHLHDDSYHMFALETSDTWGV